MLGEHKTEETPRLVGSDGRSTNVAHPGVTDKPVDEAAIARRVAEQTGPGMMPDMGTVERAAATVGGAWNKFVNVAKSGALEVATLPISGMAEQVMNATQAIQHNAEAQMAPANDENRATARPGPKAAH